LNTGHDGSMSTVHANDSEEALWRLETLVLAAGTRMGEAAVRRQLRSCIDMVVHVERRDGSRRISHVQRITQ
jgi:pilus assembly protein CpaF